MSDQYALIIVRGEKGGGKGGGEGGAARIAQESPNTLQSKSVMRVVEVLSEGEISGLADGTKSIYFDDTPLQNGNGSYNFSGVNTVFRAGTPDQAHIPGFSSVESEVTVGVKVMTTGPVVRTVNDPDTDAVRVTIRLTALTEQNTSNGDLNGSAVAFTIEYQPDGGSYIAAVAETITGKTVSPYERQYRVNLTGAAPWNIRVTRITNDNAAANIQNDLYWASYTQILDEKLVYPDTALIGLEVDSSLFGSGVPIRSYDVKGMLIKVPANYDPVTRDYTGVWDGTFTTAWSDNPAWVLYDLITSRRYGLGENVNELEADKYALYQIAQYCDGLVDDGSGGTEPRFTFNGVIQSQEDGLKVLQAVASTFRGMVYEGSDGNSRIVTAICDMPKDAVKIYSPANVIDGLFNYSSTPLEARHSAVWVTWNNPDIAYEPAVEVVEDSALIEKYGYRRLDVVAFGCARRSQASRFGRWILDSEANESEMVSFGVGIADADLLPGDVVKISDTAYADMRYGGRLAEADTSSVTVDSPVVIEVDKTYAIDVVLPDGTLATRAITNAPGTHTDLTLDTPLPTPPQVNAMWAITASDLAPRLFRVIAVKEADSSHFEVTAVLYDPDKFARVESGLYLPATTFTRLSTDVIPAPTQLNIVEYLYRSGASVQSAVTVSWQASADSRVVRYELEVKRPGPGQNYQLHKSTSGVSADVVNTADGLWSFRVRAFDALGNVSQYATIADRSLAANAVAPADVTNFNISTLPDTSTLTWSAVASLNASHYEIRFTPDTGGAMWNTSILLVERVAAGNTSVTVASRTGTYLIKAVSYPTASFPSGSYSVNATLIVTNIDSLFNFNFVESQAEDPDFLGVMIDTHLSDGNLELTEASAGVFNATGTYDFADIIDLGDVFRGSRLTPTISAFGNLTTNDVDAWENIDLITNVDGNTDGMWKIEMQVSTTDDDPSGIPAWSAYGVLTGGDYTARAFRFRVILSSFFAPVTPSVAGLSVTVDMPDVLYGDSDIASDAAGSIVTFARPFKNTNPEIAIAAQNMATGDYYEITGKSASGFVIRFFNAAGTGISRTFDYHAKGYGVGT